MYMYPAVESLQTDLHMSACMSQEEARASLQNHVQSLQLLMQFSVQGKAERLLSRDRCGTATLMRHVSFPYGKSFCH